MIMIKSSSRLPEEYQELEYIESTGTQYINTNTKLFESNNHEIIIDFEPTEFYNYNTIFGTTYDADTFEGWIYSTGGLAMRYNYVRYGTDNTILTNTRYLLNLKKENNILYKYVDNQSYGQNNVNTFLLNKDFLLFLSGTDYGKYKLYSCKLFIDNVMVRNLIPCCRKSDNEIGLYDLIQGVFFTNSGTGAFLKGKKIGCKVKKIVTKYNNDVKEIEYIKIKNNNQMVKVYDRLPIEYQRVEYIECYNQQYIDTNYIPNNKTKIIAKFAHTESSVDTPFFGVRNSNYGNSYTLWSHPIEYLNNTKSLGIFCDTSKYLDNYALGTIIEIEYSSSGIKYGEQEYTWSPRNASPDYSLILFSLANGPYIDGRRFGGKLWYFKMWDDNVLIRDLVPCYRKADNEIGLYDLVNNVFYTNSGTGQFTVGNNI